MIDPENGNNRWWPGPGVRTNQTYLILKDAVGAGKDIDKLLCQFPKYGKYGKEGAMATSTGSGDDSVNIFN